MAQFIKMFLIVAVLIGVPLGILAMIDTWRKRKPGCTGNHDCVVYKGEKVQCPSCELRERQAAQKAEKGKRTN